VKIVDIIEVDINALKILLAREKDYLLNNYYWDTEFSYKVKLQLLRHRRLEGLAAVKGGQVLGYIVYSDKGGCISMTGYYFDAEYSHADEYIFIKKVLDVLMLRYPRTKFDGQLLGINDSAKKNIFEQFGFEATRREYMLLDLETADIASNQEDAWIFSPFPDFPTKLTGFIQELAYSMYRSYFGTVDAVITESFQSLPGCTLFITSLFEYPFYGNVRTQYSLYARDIQKSMTGMILTAQSEKETVHVVQLSVVPWYQSVGVGKAMMNESLIRMKNARMKRSILMVTSDNNRALGLYKKLGYYSIACFYALNLDIKK